MKFYSLSTIRRKTKELGRKINAPKEFLRINSQPTGFGDPHIEIDKEGYHYVVWERDKELERRKTQDLDELLFWLLDDLTFKMASE
jgi:hypothetical protein